MVTKPTTLVFRIAAGTISSFVWFSGELLRSFFNWKLILREGAKVAFRNISRDGSKEEYATGELSSSSAEGTS